MELFRRESIIIFDEVQRFPKARQSIKKLVKDGRYDYLETGSLISIRQNVKDITIPSEERSIDMHPMDFEEFCLALGEAQMVNEYYRKRTLQTDSKWQSDLERGNDLRNDYSFPKSHREISNTFMPSYWYAS